MLKKAFQYVLFAAFVAFVLCGHLMFSESSSMMSHDTSSSMAQNCEQGEGHCVRSVASGTIFSTVRIADPQELRFTAFVRSVLQLNAIQDQTHHASFNLAFSSYRDRTFSTVFRL
jgi:hypothetical protein